MVEVQAAKRPAHEVILEAIEANVGDGEKLRSEFRITPPFCSAQAVQVLCDVLAASHIPEKDLGYVAVRLRGILASRGDEYHSVTIEANILGVVNELESRMEPARVGAEEPRSVAHLPESSDDSHDAGSPHL